MLQIRTKMLQNLKKINISYNFFKEHATKCYEFLRVACTGRPVARDGAGARLRPRAALAGALSSPRRGPRHGPRPAAERPQPAAAFPGFDFSILRYRKRDRGENSRSRKTDVNETMFVFDA